MPQSWNHRLGNMCLGILHIFHAFVVYFLLALNNILLSSSTMAYHSLLKEISMGQENIIFIDDGVLYSSKEEWKHAICHRRHGFGEGEAESSNHRKASPLCSLSLAESEKGHLWAEQWLASIEKDRESWAGRKGWFDVMVCIWFSQGVALLGGVALLE